VNKIKERKKMIIKWNQVKKNENPAGMLDESDLLSEASFMESSRSVMEVQSPAPNQSTKEETKDKIEQVLQEQANKEFEEHSKKNS